MDGLLVTSRELLERLLGEIEDGLMSSDSSVEESERPELDDLGRVGRRRVESESVDERSEEGKSKLIDGCGNRFGLLPPGGGHVGEELWEEKRQKTSQDVFTDE